MNPITWLLSKVTGLPEPTLRLLMTVALGYPVANMYNKRFNSDDAEGSTKEERNFFILCAGLGLNFFFNMTSIYHTLVTVGLSYGICCFFQSNRKLAAAGVWVLNATYLMAGYFFMQTDDYDITWTMTQCILCLRMMAFGFDFYDGEKKVKVAGPPSKTDLKQDNDVNKAAIRPTEQKKTPAALPLSFGIDTPLMELPSFVEVLAFANFPSAFLVGPQFSFSLYKKWLETLPTAFSFQERDERDRARNAYVIRCAALAVLYLGLQQTIGAAYSTSYLLTEEYRSHGFLARCVLFAIAGKFAYNKYIGIWLLTEGKNG
jgi:lysophospholipid acyltransferase 5